MSTPGPPGRGLVTSPNAVVPYHPIFLLSTIPHSFEYSKGLNNYQCYSPMLYQIPPIYPRNCIGGSYLGLGRMAVSECPGPQAVGLQAPAVESSCQHYDLFQLKPSHRKPTSRQALVFEEPLPTLLSIHDDLHATQKAQYGLIEEET